MQTEADPASPAGEVPSTAGEPAALAAGDPPAPALDAPDVGFPPAATSAPAVLEPPAFPQPELPPSAPAAYPVAPADSRPPERPHASIAFLVTVTALSLAADLATKAWAKGHLSGARAPHKLDVWKGHVDLIFAQNPGGAWSFLRSLPDSLRRPFFLVVSAAAIVFIVSIYRRVHRDQTTMVWGLPLALGGAMGNLADRIRYGWVVDFVDVYVTRHGHEHHWPTFNVADIAIVVGVVLMAIDMMRARGRVREERAPAPGAPTPAV
jgi:signal peptidase II